MGDLVELGVEDTLQYDMCPILDEGSKVTPERGGQYENAEILLPTGDRKQDANIVQLVDPIRTPSWIQIFMK